MIVILAEDKIAQINTWHTIQVCHYIDNSVIFVDSNTNDIQFRIWCKEHDIKRHTCFGKKGYELSEVDFIFYKMENM